VAKAPALDDQLFRSEELDCVAVLPVQVAEETGGEPAEPSDAVPVW
jgi:hypothetical protein